MSTRRTAMMKRVRSSAGWTRASGISTWTVTENGTALIADSEYLYAFNVENNSGTELPSTGGIGTTIFYIVGSLLAVGAVILLVTKKRMGKTEG